MLEKREKRANQLGKPAKFFHFPATKKRTINSRPVDKVTLRLRLPFVRHTEAQRRVLSPGIDSPASWPDTHTHTKVDMKRCAESRKQS